MKRLNNRHTRSKVKLRVINTTQASLVRALCHEIVSRAAGWGATAGLTGRKAQLGKSHVFYVRPRLLGRLRGDVRRFIRQGDIRVSIDGIEL